VFPDACGGAEIASCTLAYRDRRKAITPRVRPRATVPDDEQTRRLIVLLPDDGCGSGVGADRALATLFLALSTATLTPATTAESAGEAAP
jgi:hypothetical protein